MVLSQFKIKILHYSGLGLWLLINYLTQAVLECVGHQNTVLPFASENSYNSFILNMIRKTSTEWHISKKRKKETTEGYVKSESSNPIMSNVIVVFVILEQQTNNRQCQQHTSKRSMIVNSSTVAGPDWIINKDLCEWMGKIKHNDLVCSRVSQEACKNKRTNETK